MSKLIRVPTNERSCDGCVFSGPLHCEKDIDINCSDYENDTSVQEYIFQEVPDLEPEAQETLEDLARKLLLPALRQYRHNNQKGFVPGYEIAETEKVVLDLLHHVTNFKCKTGE